jgi:hypothetical protein
MGETTGRGGDHFPNTTMQRLFQGRPKFANAKVRMELEMSWRGELIVDVDYLVDSFNQLCPGFVSCVSWLMFWSTGLETTRPRWIDDRPRSGLIGPRDRGVRLETASPCSRGRNRKSVNHETLETHEKKAKAEILQL